MKKIFIFLLLLIAIKAFSGDKDKYINFASGYMYNGYFSNVLSYEIERKHHSALELYTDLSFYNDSALFRNPSFVLGLANKSVITRGRNQCFRFRYGADIGTANNEFKADVNLSFEYSWYFKNGCQFFILQKNDIMLWSDENLLKNGILMGFKIQLFNKY